MTYIKNTITIVLLSSLLFCAGCSKDDSPDPKAVALNKQLEALMNEGSSWVLGSTGSVMKDDIDVSSQFTGFKLTIGNKTYTTQNSLGHVWKTSGTWDFQGDNINQIVRDGSVAVSVSHDDNNLILTFVAGGKSEGARVNSISGEYVFNLVSE
jgi:hypothetical protein